MTIAALAVIGVTSVSIFVLGRRFTRLFVDRTGALPPATWMFRRTTDPELEAARRLALALLPIDIVAMVVYLAQP